MYIFPDGGNPEGFLVQNRAHEDKWAIRAHPVGYPNLRKKATFSLAVWGPSMGQGLTSFGSMQPWKSQWREEHHVSCGIGIMLMVGLCSISLQYRVNYVAWVYCTLGCSKMHFHPLIKAIDFSSVPLGELMNTARKSHMYISSTKGTDEKTMALIKGWKCILKHPIVHIIVVHMKDRIRTVIC